MQRATGLTKAGYESRQQEDPEALEVVAQAVQEVAGQAGNAAGNQWRLEAGVCPH